MMPVILTTIAFLILAEGILLILMTKEVKKFMKQIAKNKNSEKVLKKIGLWEMLIGIVLFIIAVIIRNL